VRFKACPTTTPPRFGVIVTLTAGLLTVIAAVAAFVVSAADFAVSVTPAGGILAGAV
jgi:anti-sigma-K factor RskA